MSKTGRFYMTAPNGRTYCVEPIVPKHGQKIWGDVDPATKKLTGDYGSKFPGAVTEEESIITEENGYTDITYLPPGVSPIGWIMNQKE